VSAAALLAAARAKGAVIVTAESCTGGGIAVAITDIAGSSAIFDGALNASNATIAVSVTGIAGPGGSEHKPEGRVCFGLATVHGTTTELCDFGALGRENVRARSVTRTAYHFGTSERRCLFSQHKFCGLTRER